MRKLDAVNVCVPVPDLARAVGLNKELTRASLVSLGFGSGEKGPVVDLQWLPPVKVVTDACRYMVRAGKGAWAYIESAISIRDFGIIVEGDTRLMTMQPIIWDALVNLHDTSLLSHDQPDLVLAQPTELKGFSECFVFRNGGCTPLFAGPGASEIRHVRLLPRGNGLLATSGADLLFFPPRTFEMGKETINVKDAQRVTMFPRPISFLGQIDAANNGVFVSFEGGMICRVDIGKLVERRATGGTLSIRLIEYGKTHFAARQLGGSEVMLALVPSGGERAIEVTSGLVIASELRRPAYARA